MVDFITTPSADSVLQRITRTIVARCQPRRVILIGSRARGDALPDADYDLVVEFDTDPQTAFDRSREVYDALWETGLALDVIPRGIGEIERSADDPGTLDWDIVREGKVLYSADGCTEVVRGGGRRSDRVREEPPGRRRYRKPPASVRVWIARARRDLDHARSLMDRGDAWDFICFHAQQAGEKFLKGLLVDHLVRPRRTHKLQVLLDDLRAVGTELPGIDADCRLLTPYAVATRYGVAARFDEAKGRAAVAAAERIAAAVQHGLRE